MDDWFDVARDKGAVRVEKTGPRTAALRFDPLSKEGVSFNAGDVDIRHLVSPHRFAHDEGLVTFSMGGRTFTISMDALLAQGSIWYEDGSVFVTPASDLTSFEAYQREVKRRGGPGRRGEASGVQAAEGSIASMVRQMPKQSLSGARLGQPERHEVAMMLHIRA